MLRIFTFLLSLTFVLNAQDFNVRHIKTNSENFPSLISSLQVYDSFDEPITGLKDINFSASVDGKNSDSVKTATYKESGLGFNIMLCLDLSGTMSGQPIATLKTAILKFIDDMRAVDKLGLIGFANDAQLISDFSNDKEYLRDKVNGLKTSGAQTALYYGAYKGLSKLIDNKEKVGKIALLIGDGKNESVSSSYTEDDVIEAAKKEGIPIFTIGYTKIDKSYLQSLERISEKTGGNFYNSPTDDDLSKQYQKLYRQILNIYLINYVASGIAGDGAEHINVITVNDKGVSKTISNKFVAPAGVAAVDTEKKIISSPAFPMWYYYILIAVVILFVGLSFLLYTKSKKRKAEEARIKAEDERKKNEQIEAERKKRLELEKKLEEANRPKPVLNNEKVSAKSFTAEEKTLIAPAPREEKTIIVKPGQQIPRSISNLRLEVLVGPNQGSRFEITTAGAAVGRKDENNIVIKEETISGHHAKITFQNGAFFLQDLGSSNGTFINGKQIQSCQLNHGDVFKFGKCEGTVTIY